MRTKIDTFIAEIKSLPNSKENGVSSKDFYIIGKKHGLTCKEVQTNFLGKANQISRGRYSVFTKIPSPANNIVATKKATKKSVKIKDDKVTLETNSKITKSMLKEVDESTGVVVNTEDSFVWIASPAEIASDLNFHTTEY